MPSLGSPNAWRATRIPSGRQSGSYPRPRLAAVTWTYSRLTGNFACPIFRTNQPSRTLCSFGKEEADEGHSECKCEAIRKALYLHRLPVLLS